MPVGDGFCLSQKLVFEGIVCLVGLRDELFSLWPWSEALDGSWWIFVVGVFCGCAIVM